MKQVSVIIPVYGVENYIAATIESVLAQTYQNFELLIVDDASPDRSIEICQQFTDPRIKIIRQENRGLAGARNTGIRQAQGDYIAFLDGDDLWLPDKLEKHLQHLENSPEVGVSFSRSEFIDIAGNSLGTYLMPQLTGIDVICLLKGSPIGNGSAAVLRRAVLDAIKFRTNFYGSEEDFYFDDAFRQSEDIECWLRIVLTTPWQIEGIPEALTLYRVNAAGLSANFLKQLDSWERVIAKTRSYAPEVISKYESMARAYELRYLARSAVRQKAGTMAAQLMGRSLASYWRIVLEEPRRTLLTGVAACLLWLLPQSFYGAIEKLGSQLAGLTQKRRIAQDTAEPAQTAV